MKRMQDYLYRQVQAIAQTLKKIGPQYLTGVLHYIANFQIGGRLEQLAINIFLRGKIVLRAKNNTMLA
jgi:hypothetical protein